MGMSKCSVPTLATSILGRDEFIRITETIFQNMIFLIYSGFRLSVAKDLHDKCVCGKYKASYADRCLECNLMKKRKSDEVMYTKYHTGGNSNLKACKGCGVLISPRKEMCKPCNRKNTAGNYKESYENDSMYNKHNLLDKNHYQKAQSKPINHKNSIRGSNKTSSSINNNKTRGNLKCIVCNRAFKGVSKLRHDLTVTSNRIIRTAIMAPFIGPFALFGLMDLDDGYDYSREQVCENCCPWCKMPRSKCTGHNLSNDSGDDI